MIQQPMNEEDAVRSEDQANEDHTAQAEAAQEEQETPQNDTEPAAEGAEGAADSEGDADVWRDKYLRLYAEFDNFRKRTMRERGDLVRSAGRDVMEALLPVLDDFERALAAGEGQDLEQMKEGYLLIGQKMRGILEAKGLQRMEAKEAAFDTDLHEAITQIPAPEPNMVGKVVDVVEPGYKLHDTVLRFAKVVVGN
ncbi:MAG: nucleotide exchange factor GrpE [Flavobacteriales bacterium]|nr:nucleotide exchange factor GrpE [Flavobacteriales bacterium]